MHTLKTTAGIGWAVDTVPVVLDGKPTAYFNIVRRDTKFVLGNCTERYRIQQNDEFVQDTLESAKDNGFKFKSHRTGTVDKNGKQVFVQFDTGQYSIGKDEVSESVTVIHHHDGRPVTNQSFCSYSVKDGPSFNLGMKAGKEVEDVMCFKCAQEFVDDIRRMSGADINIGEVDDLVSFLINPNNKSMSDRMRSMEKHLKAAIGSADPANVWDVFKGVVGYTETIKSSKDRKASMFVGSSARMTETAFLYLSSRSRGK